ncbi:MAG: hypothetical protein AAGI69_24220 [Cyanobacteria bacterium P01_H01_bin.21]
MKNKNYVLILALVFLMPFNGLSIDIGVSIRPFNLLNFLLFFSVIKTVVKILVSNTKTSPSSLTLVIKIFSLFIGITVLSNLIFILFGEVTPEALYYFDDKFSGGTLGFLRTSLKPLQVMLSYLLIFSLTIVSITSIKKHSEIVSIAWSYVISSSVAAFLGIFQYFYYVVSGVNLFPIYRGGLVGVNSYTQDAVFVMGGIKFLRINAFAGEPKYLATFLILGLGTILFFLINQCSKKHKTVLAFLFLIQLLAVMLTFSTLGYAMLIICLLFYLYIAKRKLYLYTFLGIIALLGYLFIGYPQLVVDIFDARFLSRLGLEDMDVIYVEFIKEFPDYIWFGTGFGNFHLASFAQTQKILSWNFGIILPKLGLFIVMATSGIFGTLIFYSIPILVIKRLSYLANYLNKNTADFYWSLKNLIIFLSIIGLVMRSMPLAFLWLGIGFSAIEEYAIHKKLRCSYSYRL